LTGIKKTYDFIHFTLLYTAILSPAVSQNEIQSTGGTKLKICGRMRDLQTDPEKTCEISDLQKRSAWYRKHTVLNG